MSKSKQFLLKFIGLKDGNHNFDYDLENKFFTAHDYMDFNSCDIKVKVQLIKRLLF